MNEKDYKMMKLLGEMDESYIVGAAKPWKTGKASGRSRRREVWAASAVLVVACGMLGTFHPQVNAAVRELVSRIGQIAGREADFAPYASQMEMTQTKDGVTLTLQEVVLTDNQLYAAVAMDTDLEQAWIGECRVYFDGSEDGPTSYSSGFLQGNAAEHEVVVEYRCADGLLPLENADITLELTVYEDGADETSGVRVPFAFTFAASDTGLKGDTLQLALAEAIEIRPGVVLELQEFTQNSIFSRIRTKCGENSGSLPIGKYLYYLKGEDSLGGEVSYAYQSENGPYGYFYAEETQDGSLMPSEESEWVELQLYAQEIPTDGSESPMVPTGEKFRIDFR